MIVAGLVILSLLLAIASVAAFLWPLVDSDELIEAMHTFYEERDR